MDFSYKFPPLFQSSHSYCLLFDINTNDKVNMRVIRYMYAGGEFNDLQAGNPPTHLKMFTSQDQGGKVFANAIYGTVDLQSTSYDQGICLEDFSGKIQPAMPSPEMFGMKRGNIQPQAQTAQKPNKVLTPRKTPPPSLIKDTTDIAPPSLKTKPVYHISPEEMKAMDLDNRMMTPLYLQSSDQSDKEKSKLGKVMWCDQNQASTDHELLDDGTLTEKLNFNNRVDQFDVDVDNVQQTLQGLQGQEPKMIGSYLTMPTDAIVVDEGLQNQQEQTRMDDKLPFPVTESYSLANTSDRWDTDANNFQQHLTAGEQNLTPADMDLITELLGLDVHTYDPEPCQVTIPTSDDQPVETAQSDKLSYGTSNALVHLATNHQNYSSTGLTGLITRKDFLFIGRENIQHLESLGEGSFGQVNLYRGPSQNNKMFVIKQILDKGKFRQEEVIIGCLSDSPYLLKTFGLMLPEIGGPKLIMDYGGKSLLLFAQHQKLQEKEIWSLTNQMCKGLKHLADKGIIHFDIKPENMFVMTDQQGLFLRLGDFGSAKLPSSNTIDYSTWTPEYMAPEMIRLVITEKFPHIVSKSGNEITDITTKCDIFPAGLVVLFMYLQSHFLLNTEYIKHKNAEDSSVQRIAIMFDLTMNPDMLLDRIPEMVTEPMRSIVTSMLQGYHGNRGSADDVIKKMEELSLMGVPAQPLTEIVCNRPKRKESNVVIMKPEDVIKGKGKHGQRNRRRSSRTSSTKGGKKVIEKVHVDEEMSENVPKGPSELENKVFEQPQQIRKRMVKGILKDKLQKRKHTDSNFEDELMDTMSPSSVGKQMRMSVSSEVMSPIGNNFSASEFSLDLGNVVTASGPVCQAEDDGMTEQAVPGNIPNLDFDSM
ncbi:hypothetical protein FSP39_005457 [Pinctada imbricata]|uniref:Protein kinase domain-containing protein n=1 Tax=Pinctada imbricata TaxID=66713 RepID=A0AA88YUW4_PINIB|nr:hypothetical protein FSP39_005457 [Pinctada imbricata]